MDLRSGDPFWLLQGDLFPAYPQLDRDKKCDVAILGGGITGALVAYHLAQTGIPAILLDPPRGFFLSRATDFADQNHRISLGIVVEEFYGIKMGHPVNRIATDSDTGRLAITARGNLPHGFIGKRAGS